MNEIANYFEPINTIKPNPDYGLKDGYLHNEIVQNSFSECNIALIGVSETRNAITKTEPTELDQVRAYLYGLSAFSNLKIADLGNLKLGNTVKDTYASIEFVANYLINNNVIPVFFGGTHDITVPLAKSLKESDCEIVIIDSRFDLGSTDVHSKNFIEELITDNTNDNRLTIAAFQSYFVSKSQKAIAEKLGLLNVRLGEIRNNFSFVEPPLRDADFVSFDLSAIRQPDCPACTFPGPNGLYNEEACQLANLSGLSDKLKLFYISEYDFAKDKNHQSAQIVAQLLWHFMYGVSQRKGDYPAKTLDSYKKIFVKIEKPDTELVFYQNPVNNRFWVEIPLNTDQQVKIISCSEKDYRKTCVGEIPDRIWKNISRYFN